MLSSLSYILGAKRLVGRNDLWGETTSGAKRLVGAKRLGGKRPRRKRLGGETTRGGNGLGAKRPGFKVGIPTLRKKLNRSILEFHKA